MERIKIPTGETLFQECLPNGLVVFVLPKAKFLRTYGVLSTHYGSLDSKFKVPREGVVEVPPGVAHFLEHKLFEEEEGNVFERFAAWGASVNAFTSYTQTSYLFSTVEKWQDCLIQLMEFVNSPYLTAENVEKEKGIIVQELQMYADHPNHRIHSRLLENLYHEHPVRLDIGGTVNSVRDITVEDLRHCYYTFYQPSNMALVVVGDVDPRETLRLVQANLPAWKNHVGPIERLYPSEPQHVAESWAEETLRISRPRYLMGFKHDPIWQGRELLRQQILMSIGMRLIASRSSRVYAELYETDLVDDSFGASFNSDPRYAYSVLGSETSDPDSLHGELVRVINEFKANAVSSSDVERLKRQLYGAHLSSYDSFEYTANRVVSHYFNGTPYHEYLDLVESVTAAEVHEAMCQQFDWDRSTVSILRPVNAHG